MLNKLLSYYHVILYVCIIYTDINYYTYQSTNNRNTDRVIFYTAVKHLPAWTKILDTEHACQQIEEHIILKSIAIPIY